MAELNDASVRKAGRRDKPYYLGDGRGLWLYVSQTGGKYWRCRYTSGGRQRILSLGEYPEMGLAEARDARQAARNLVREGRDPAAVRMVGFIRMAPCAAGSTRRNAMLSASSARS